MWRNNYSSVVVSSRQFIAALPYAAYEYFKIVFQVEFTFEKYSAKVESLRESVSALFSYLNLCGAYVISCFVCLLCKSNVFTPARLARDYYTP
jgi:hypothetical protein